jgi:hypothetical protein
MHKTCELRAALMSIPDELAARMPLSYVHFTHFLVDSLLLLAPFALYPKTGFFSVFMTGVGGRSLTSGGLLLVFTSGFVFFSFADVGTPSSSLVRLGGGCSSFPGPCPARVPGSILRLSHCLFRGSGDVAGPP